MWSFHMPINVFDIRAKYCHISHAKKSAQLKKIMYE